MFENLDPKLKARLDDALRRSANTNPRLAEPYADFLASHVAKALSLPLRQGVLSGDIISDIFTRESFPPGTHVEYPLDFIAPGTEDELVAYTIPDQGYIPQKTFEGDYVAVPTYRIGGSIDWNLKYARDARWNIVARAGQALQVQFVKKKNDDGWHTLLAAAVDRNIIIYDGTAAVGQFTKRLVSLMKTAMRRNGGGNSTSLNRRALTDLYLSPEAQEDMRNWNVDQVDEQTRNKIFNAGDDILTRIFGVNLHVIDELGVGQEYQTFMEGALGISMPGGDTEIVLGLSKNPQSTFMMPIRDELQLFNDPVLHRQQRQGMYGWEEIGFAVLDGRDLILGSL